MKSHASMPCINLIIYVLMPTFVKMKKQANFDYMLGSLIFTKLKWKSGPQKRKSLFPFQETPPGLQSRPHEQKIEKTSQIKNQSRNHDHRVTRGQSTSHSR